MNLLEMQSLESDKNENLKVFNTRLQETYKSDF